MKSDSFPWYEQVKPDVPITQGDLIDSCPVLAFDQIPSMAPPVHTDAILAALEGHYGVLPTRVVVMTQACDLAQGKARSVIMCPVNHVDDYRNDWEAALRAAGKSPKPDDWPNRLKQIKDGRILNLCLLKEWKAQIAGNLSIPRQIVDFGEVFSLPFDFLNIWVLAQNQNRLRLLPPYREHLSQAFARYFMRVGLPQDVDPGA